MNDGAKWRGVVADIERAASARGRIDVGCFVIEGTRVHERAIRSGTQVDRAVISDRAARQPDERMQQLLDELRTAGTTLFTVPDSTIEKLTNGRSIGAIVGLVPLPQSTDLERLMKVETGRRCVILVAVNVEDPGNVGALCRTALASGCSGLIAVGISDPYHPRAVRTSMGSLFKLPIMIRDEVEPLLEDLAKSGVQTLAAVSTGGIALPDLPENEWPRAVLVGREAFGLPKSTADSADLEVSIPMAGEVDSFSVNAAAAVVLYELLGRVSVR